MSNQMTPDNIRFDKVLPVRPSGSIESINKLLNDIIASGILNTDGTLDANSKKTIQQFYIENAPTRAEFANFLNILYAPHGYHGVTSLDRRQAYLPFNIVYNNAGLQFLFRDLNMNINTKCLPWSEVARRVEKQIKSNEYVSEDKNVMTKKYQNGGMMMNERKNTDYTILESVQVGNTEFVLGESPTAPSRFVTWQCSNGDNYFWGHYVDDYDTAKADLNKRVEGERRYQHNLSKPVDKEKESAR